MVTGSDVLAAVLLKIEPVNSCFVFRSTSAQNTFATNNRDSCYRTF